MFVLRRISGEGIEMNKVIGDGYTVIDRESTVEDFKKVFEHYFEKRQIADLDSESDFDTKNCYAFVTNDSFIQPLYKNQQNYIMSENGKTFSNLTYR
ncbi:hypothetical protein M2T79_18555 [Elizabethkingia miricola]|uniref:hypothetical protein n=1 Tax=Elizabethkingia miricola TaxID=172045 RepID=UPI002019D33E|nr:hypothetical protein [Elizabethkingia miricola]MCL1658612.1 hypothetical protein [Elizabethkingia miricola]